VERGNKMPETDDFLIEYTLNAIRDYRADIRSRTTVVIQILGLMIALEGVVVGSVLTGSINNELVFYSIFGKGAIALSMILLSLLLYIITWLELDLLHCQVILLREKIALYEKGFKNVGKDEPTLTKSLPSYVYAFAILLLVINFLVGITQNVPVFEDIVDYSVWISIIAVAISFVLLTLIHFVRKSYIKEKKMTIQKMMNSLLESLKKDMRSKV